MYYMLLSPQIRARSKYVKMFTRISLMRWEDIAHASTEILELLKPPAPTDNQELRDLKEHLQDALWSGGGEASGVT